MWHCWRNVILASKQGRRVLWTESLFTEVTAPKTHLFIFSPQNDTFLTFVKALGAHYRDLWPDNQVERSAQQWTRGRREGERYC